MLKTIIFDWHGVLDTTKFEDLVKHLSNLSGLTNDQVNLLLKKNKKSYAMGEISPKEFWGNVKSALNLDDNKLKEVKEHSLLIIKNTSLWELLQSFQKKFILAILSDCPKDKVDEIRSKIDLSLFKESIFSSEVGMMKDSDDFFFNITNLLGIQPNEAIYIDDTSKHIETARRLGFLTHQFTMTKAFKAFITSTLT